jgi:glycine C-acetyltransferase
MIKDNFSSLLDKRLRELQEQGVSKRFEQVITGMQPAADGSGPRYFLEGFGDRAFLRMNSNSYLGMSQHPTVVAAEEQAARIFGTGPGAVRFISGTYKPHRDLEQQLADFHGRQDAMLFSAAYATVLGVLPSLISGETLVLSDELNHNCIINSLRLAKPQAKEVYKHLDMCGLERQLKYWAGGCKRVLVVTDGIFSMRGDHAPLRELQTICDGYQSEFEEGIVTVMDDSHGVGAFGGSGRGVEEYTGARVDILVATLGKAIGVNGGYVAADRSVIDYLRETSPLYIYSNPITPSEAAAAFTTLRLLDSEEGVGLLGKLRTLIRRLEKGLTDLGYEVLESEHPIVPLMVRDTAKTSALVAALFKNNILVTGLNFPVVPRGDEEIRFQVSADHTEQDIEYLLDVMKKCRE